MVQISRAILCLAATCYAAVTSIALASTEGNTTASVPVASSSNATALRDTEKAGIQWTDGSCNIVFTYWEHDKSATFEINFVHSKGVDYTTEKFHDDSMPIQTSNEEHLQNGKLKLIQIWPRQEMVCISSIWLNCGGLALDLEYGDSKYVTITADAIQESWIRKTGGQRKPVNWDHGPCMYFRNADWDKGAFRALDIYRGVFDCGSDYMCIAGHLETFSH